MPSPSRTTMAARPRKAAHPIGGADITKMRRPPTHPGEVFLKEVLEPRGRGAQAEAARRMNMRPAFFNDIIAGRRPVSPETAILMAKVSGTSPQFWLRLQADYDLWQALQTTDTSKVRALEPLEA